MGYIYKITNSVNDKMYVGKTTTTLEHRWKYHIKDALRKRNFRSKLYSAMEKYGCDKFSISQIEECDNSIINDRERYWIKYYGTVENGYNIMSGGDGNNIITDTEAANMLKLWEQGLTQKEISERIGRNHKAVKRILYANGVTREQILKRQDEVTKGSRVKAVYVYDADGKFIGEYESLITAEKVLGIHHTTIGHVIHGKLAHARGLRFTDYKVDKLEPITNRRMTKVKVYQYRTNGEYVASYESTADASKAVGLKDDHGLRTSCQTCNSLSGGYQWRYYKAERIEPFTKTHFRSKLRVVMI